MTLILSELEAAARAATPGPWNIEENVKLAGFNHLAIVNRAAGRDWMLCSVTNMETAREADYANARHIAAASPNVVLRLCEVVRDAIESGAEFHGITLDPISPAEEPNYEYRVTTGPRKVWDQEPDLTKEGWEPDPDHGRPGESWDRLDYHEERYWRRLKSDPPAEEPRALREKVAAELARVAAEHSYEPNTAKFERLADWVLDFVRRYGEQVRNEAALLADATTRGVADDGYKIVDAIRAMALPEPEA